MKNGLKTALILKKAQSALEFLVVFSLLLIFFLIVADVGLFFKEIYTVQAVSDEALSRLTSAQVCSDSDEVKPLLVKSVETYHPTWVDAVKFNYSGNALNGTYTSQGANRSFKFSIKCRTNNSPSSLVFTHRYYGLFMFVNGKYVTSNISTNTTFY